MTVEKVFMFHHRDRKHPSLLSGNPCQLSANLLTCGGDLVLPTTSQEDIISPPLDSIPPTHKHFPGILPKNLLHTTTFSFSFPACIFPLAFLFLLPWGSLGSSFPAFFLPFWQKYSTSSSGRREVCGTFPFHCEGLKVTECQCPWIHVPPSDLISSLYAS